MSLARSGGCPITRTYFTANTAVSTADTAVSAGIVAAPAPQTGTITLVTAYRQNFRESEHLVGLVLNSDLPDLLNEVDPLGLTELRLGEWCGRAKRYLVDGVFNPQKVKFGGKSGDQTLEWQTNAAANSKLFAVIVLNKRFGTYRYEVVWASRNGDEPDYATHSLRSLNQRPGVIRPANLGMYLTVVPKGVVYGGPLPGYRQQAFLATWILEEAPKGVIVDVSPDDAMASPHNLTFIKKDAGSWNAEFIVATKVKTELKVEVTVEVALPVDYATARFTFAKVGPLNADAPTSA